MPSAKQLLRDRIDQVSEDEAREILGWLEMAHALASEQTARETLIRRIQGRPGFGVPADDTAPFAKFEPIRCPGTPASKLLLADRR